LFAGFFAQDGARKYPRWRHHKILPSKLVYNTSDDEQARAEGYEDPHVPITANPSIPNWYWDLEDMSKRQLLVYARDEFGVELPAEARHETLLSAVLKLGKLAPQHRSRLVLMAHTIKMNYDATLAEIRRMMGQPDGTETEVEKYEVYL